MFAAAALAVVVTAGAHAQMQETSPPSELTALREIERVFVDIGERLRPAVVNIDVKGSREQGMNDLEDLFRQFGLRPFQTPQRPENLPAPEATGSGFIIDQEGHIITNNHVVDEATEITVTLNDGTELPARVVGLDPDTDLAVIKIEADRRFQTVELGDSDALKVGQFAIAMGSPRGLEGSLSFGHVTALGRERLAIPGLRFYGLIQTDAAINLGNSGGPLVDINGRVIGINTAIVFGAEGLGFAIPVNTAKKVVPALIAEGKVTRGYLGVIIKEADEYVSALGLPDDKGAFVDMVSEGTPADRAGVQPYDVIRKVNGEMIETDTDLVNTISDYAPGEEVVLEIWRDGRPMELEVTLDEFPGMEQVAAVPGTYNDLGLQVEELSPELIEGLNLDPEQQGVIIRDIEAGSPADDSELRRGDIILEIGKEDVTSVSEFNRLADQLAQPGSDILVRIRRGDAPPTVEVIEIPEE
jgi:serine protease Do